MRSALKEKNLLPGEQIISFKSQSPFVRQAMKGLLPLKVYPLKSKTKAADKNLFAKNFKNLSVQAHFYNSKTSGQIV